MTVFAWLRARLRSLFGLRETSLPPGTPHAAQLERRLHAAEGRAAEARKRASSARAQARDAETRARTAEHDAEVQAEDDAQLHVRIRDLEARLKAAQARLEDAEARMNGAEAKARANPPAKDSRDAVHGGTAEAHFSPGDGCLQALRAQFARAKRTIDVCVFTITDDRIAGFVLDAHRRGVKVRVITDNDKALDEGSDVGRLARAGIPVRQDLTEHHMHHKFAVFDQRVLVTGSYNWTRSATNFNAENIVVLDEPRLIEAFHREFDALWDRYEPL